MMAFLTSFLITYNTMEGGKTMHKMNRRKFMKTTGKVALAGATALSIEPLFSGLVQGHLEVAYASDAQAGFNVYNGINPNTKDIVSITFKDCLSKGWAPGVCYKTSKPMVAVADGTVTEVIKMEDLGSRYGSFRKEKNDAKGYLVRAVHGNIESMYSHLTMPEVKFSQKIKRGEIIGYPDERWNMPRLNFAIEFLITDPNNYGIDNSFMTYWDGATDLEIGKDEQNQRLEIQQKILNKFGEMVEGPEKYDLYRKKHKGIMLYKWSRIEKFRYTEYLVQNKPETFPSLTKEQFSEMKKEFYSKQPIILTLPFKKG